MKKLIAMLVAVFLCLSVMAIPAMADGGQISISSDTVTRGNQVTLSISASGDVEFSALKIRISYDKSALKIVGCSNALGGMAFQPGNPDNATYAPLWYGAGNVSANGVIGYITFEALTNAAKGSYSIGVSVEDCSNQEGNDVAMAGGAGTITITIPPCANHTWNDGDVTKPATCEDTGIKTYTCTVCGETKTEVIPSLGGHKWDAGTVTKAATCEGTGVRTFTCTVCSATKTEEIAATGHTWDEGSVTKPATCEGTGVKTYTCKTCQATRIEEIASLGGHKWDAGAVTNAATCEGTGVKTYTCTVCQATKTEEIAATGHTWDEGNVTKPATCEGTGIKTYTCKACKATRTEEIAATGHTWDEGAVTKPATCEGTGVKTYTCKTCQTTRTEEIAALGHKWGAWMPVQGEDSHSRQCSACQASEKVAHSWDGGKVTKPATCAVDGEKTFTCATCRTTRIETIPATGVHDFTDHYEHAEGENVHYGVCACGQKGPAEKHQYTQEGDILEKPTTTKEGKQEKLCVCGAKTVVTLAMIPAEYDEVPRTGDITNQLILTALACLLVIGGAVRLFRRKTAR